MSVATTTTPSVLPLPITPAVRSSASSLSTSGSISLALTNSQSSTQVTTTTTSSTVLSTTAQTSTPTFTSSSSSANPSSSSVSSSASVAAATSSRSATPGITSISSGPSASTYTQFVSAPSASATRDVAPSQANTSFFGNKGAVIGVFTVVGLIGAAVFIAIVTACIRRRRAKQFDMDVAEAAREAAATSAAHHPFADDDYTSYGGHSTVGGGRGGGGYTGYSAESHGTYEQPAMSLGGRANESYVMSDVGGGAGAYDSRYPSTTAGAAGIGAAVGAAAMQRARSRKEYGSGGGDYSQTQERTPYPAFVAGPAAPAAPNHEMSDQPSSGSGRNSGMRYRRGTDGRTPDLLEAAGLLGSAGAVAGAAGTGYTIRPLSDQPQYTDLSRNTQGQGQGRGSDEIGYPTSTTPNHFMQATVPSRESYIGNGPYHVVYPLPPPQQQQNPGTYTPEPPTPSEDPFRRNTMPIPASVSAVMPNDQAEDEEDAYGGYADDRVEGGHHRGGSDESRYSDLHRRDQEGESEERASFQDEEDYGRQPRVLKVANE